MSLLASKRAAGASGLKAQKNQPMPMLLPARAAAPSMVSSSRGACNAPSMARAQVVVKATSEQGTATASASSMEGNWVAVCRPEDLPKGVRKEIDVDGRQVLMFWYRNQIYCIESRSPAEGAYSEGFIKSKFTQDFCIECPTTGSLFSLKDGSIVSWYPTNPVLRAVTPQSLCRPLAIFPVKMTQDALMLDVTKGRSGGGFNKGGAGTSIDNNNVFTVQPNVYFEGMDPAEESATIYTTPVGMGEAKQNPAITLAAVLAVGAVAVAGAALAAYNFILQ